jgi:putative ABC transport system ATP-binding protein
MTMDDILIRLEGVEKEFGTGANRVRALADLHLVVFRGEFIAVTGPSGSGKSTLLNLLAGLDTLTAGRVVIEGTCLSEMTDDELTIFRRRHVGIIFQFFNLLPTLTAAENVALPLRADGIARREIMTRVDGALGLVDMRHRAGHRPGELSGGEMQRVAIARALVINPFLLLADEPTGNLDSKMGQDILELIKSTSERTGLTVVLVTHDLRAAAYGDRMVALRDGRIVDEVTARDRTIPRDT